MFEKFFKMQEMRDQIAVWMKDIGLGNASLDIIKNPLGDDLTVIIKRRVWIEKPLPDGNITELDGFKDVENDLLASELFYRAKESKVHPSNKVTLENVSDVVRYHKPAGDQPARHEALSAATEHFIKALLLYCPDCADRSSAIRHARIAKMEGSAAIALET